MSIEYEQRAGCVVGSPCRAQVRPATNVVLKNDTSVGRLRLTGGSTRTPVNLGVSPGHSSRDGLTRAANNGRLVE
jgi:hypothetical protein